MRYINPGFAEFLDVEGGTTVEGKDFNPDNGVALYQPKDNEGVDISLETAPTHFYAKFDVYIPPWSEMSDGIMAKVGFYSNHSGYIGFCGWQLRKYSSDIDPQVIIGNGSSYDKYVEYKVGGALKFGEVNSFWMHFKARSTRKSWKIRRNTFTWMPSASWSFMPPKIMANAICPISS